MKCFEVIAMNSMQVMENVEKMKASCNVSGDNRECKHSEDTLAFKKRSLILKIKFSQLEANKGGGPSASAASNDPPIYRNVGCERPYNQSSGCHQ